MSHIVPGHLTDLHMASKIDASSLVPRRPYGGSGVRNASTLYPRKAVSADEEPQIPDPTLFASLALTRSAAAGSTAPGSDPDSDLPTMTECAVHLELLEVFHKLRLDIIKSKPLDTTFGVRINKKTVYRRDYSSPRRGAMKAVELRDATWQDRRRQKWPYILGLAAGRFRLWIRKMDEFLKAQAAEDVTGLPFLPPLDVLMVWHGFLLNPHDYDTACRRDGMTGISRLPFPWKDVHAAIDPRDWSYTLTEASAAWARSHAGLEPDLCRYLSVAARTATTSVISRTLARYGQQQQTHVSPLEDLQRALASKDLPSRDAAFLATLLQTEADREADKPLVDNVQRQASFIDKMHAQLWIRSPAAGGTLRRAVDRYAKFLRLFRLHPGTMLVPTLDIDIVWHTHQCSARGYAESVRRRTGAFVNHNDRHGSSVLDGGMQGTTELFIVRYGEEYNKCLCWDCEAMASAVEEANGSMESGSASGLGKDPRRLAERVRKDVEYYRCVEIMRREGNQLPLRDP